MPIPDSCIAAIASYSITSSALLELPRDFEAKRLRGFQIDDKFELARPLDGQVARFCASQDSINIARNEVAVAEVGSKIYVVGGRGQSGELWPCH